MRPNARRYALFTLIGIAGEDDLDAPGCGASPIWLNSATPHRDLLAIVRGRGLLPWLDGVLGGPASKTANLRAALAAERVAPRQALMVGDGPDDLEAARALGTLFVAITAENRLTGNGPFAMRDLARLPALIDRIRSRPVRASRRAGQARNAKAARRTLA